MNLIRISESDDSIVDYDKERGMYRVSIFEDGHFKDEIWFDAYEDKEVKDLYLVYGNINESGDTNTWVADIFDNLEQAEACAEWHNTVKTQDNVSYYASSDVWFVNKWDYAEDLKKLKGEECEV
jgi:hypothetical protein